MTDPDEPAGLPDLAARCRALEARVQQLERINAALMERVESDTDAQANSFALFQSAIALESQVRERTAALQEANTHLRASNEAAHQASRAKSEFLAAMSHELRTPMNGVVGMVEVLLNTPLEAGQRRAVQTIQDSALSLLRILNDILDFSKIEAGRLEIEEVPFDLRDTVERALGVLRPQIDAKGLELRLDWPDTVPNAVLGDSTRFAQIVTNLVGNAVKFTASGRVGLRVRPGEVSGDRRYCRFEVEDTGVGIRPESIPRLFQSFSQADSSTTREFGGTGLGLVIVKRLCGLMGGQCGVESEFGKGSCFWFELPLRLNREVTPPPEEAAVVPATRDAARQRRVLVVEDNAVNQMVVTGLLAVLHCACETADNGRLAIDRLSADPDFDLVLMDCQMPVMDGFAATREIRARGLGRSRLPIVALTANAMVGDRDQCLASGMDDFLSKPFQLKDLEATLHRWCP